MPRNNEVITAIVKMMSHIKERVKIDIREGATKGTIDLNKDSVKQIENIVESSIEKNFMNSINFVKKVIKK